MRDLFLQIIGFGGHITLVTTYFQVGAWTIESPKYNYIIMQFCTLHAIVSTWWRRKTLTLLNYAMCLLDYYDWRWIYNDNPFGWYHGIFVCCNIDWLYLCGMRLMCGEYKILPLGMMERSFMLTVWLSLTHKCRESNCHNKWSIPSPCWNPKCRNAIYTKQYQIYLTYTV
jgi:hypothetical protein